MDPPSDEVWQLPVLTRALSDDAGSGDEEVRVGPCPQRVPSPPIAGPAPTPGRATALTVAAARADADRVRHVHSEEAPSTVLNAMAHQLKAASNAMLQFREDAAHARARAAAGAEAQKACVARGPSARLPRSPLLLLRA